MTQTQRIRVYFGERVKPYEQNCHISWKNFSRVIFDDRNIFFKPLVLLLGEYSQGESKRLKKTVEDL